MSTASRSFRFTRGLSLPGVAVLIVFLCLAGFGGWYGYSYYQVTQRETAMSKSLDDVARFRDGKPRVSRIRQKVVEVLRAQGGTVTVEDVSVHVEPLTPAIIARLPDVQQRRLNIACAVGGSQHARSMALERVKEAQGFADAVERGQPPPERKPLPTSSPGQRAGCTPELLGDLGYTFLHVKARVTVKRGLVRRTFTVESLTFHSGPIRDDQAKSGAGQGVEGDEEDSGDKYDHGDKDDPSDSDED